jgi:hypothetical protein
VEFHLPRRFSVEVDALYERIHLTGQVQQVPIPNTDSLNAVGSAWQFPVLAKFQLLRGPVVPFVLAGPSVRLMRFSGVLLTTTLLPTIVTSMTELDESHGKIGFEGGGGIDIRLGRLRLSPEFRYAYYGGGIYCMNCGTVQPLPGLNSAAVFLGIGF